MEANVINSLLTGTAPIESNEIHQAVAIRFERIRDCLVERTGDYVYIGNRCVPQNLGWRFCQNVGGFLGCTDFNPAEILAGRFDAEIEETWHDAAGAEHWYMYEKDWG